MDKIKLYNRKDCCQEHIVRVTVYVGINIFPGEVTAKRVSIWEGVDQSGWVFEVRGGKSYLSLAEVEVYGIETVNLQHSGRL